MYAMQYQIVLPADYDMGVIRERIATRGHMTDDFDGLGLKAYMYRERGVGGSSVNEYACFYLWNDIGGMSRFLWGGKGFGGIVAGFGRPVVKHWTGVAASAGTARAFAPRSATRQIELLPADVDPTDVVEAELASLRKTAATDGVHTTALAIDPRVWELVRFTLWQGEPAPDAPGDRYEVRHLSAPGIDALPADRV